MGSRYCSDGIYRPLNRMALPFPEDPYMDCMSSLHKNTQDSRYASKPALIDGLTGEMLTFSEFKDKVRALAAGLHTKLGIKQGDVVLILCPNSIWYPVVFFAICSMGAAATTVNPVYTNSEVGKQIKDCHARLVITVPELLEKVTGSGLPVVLMGDAGAAKSGELPFTRFSDLLASDPRRAPNVRVRQDSTAALLYSSGTTGMSKGVILSHRNLMATALMFMYDADSEERERVFLVLLPMFHVYGLAILVFSQLYRGYTVVSLPKYELELALKTVEKYRITDFPLVPPIFLSLVKQPIVGKYDLSSIIEITSGAAPLGKDLMEEGQRRFPSWRIRQGYGMTETAGLVSVGVGGADISHFGSVGALMAGMEAKVVDVVSGNPQPPNNVGEIWVRGPNIMQGYLNNPEATASTLDSEEWLHTGDLVYFDDRGLLYIVDRIKELIKYKGFQVAPAELEGLLLTHPQIMDAAVVPLADDEAGEVPIAYVVRSPESNLTEREVKSFIAEQVAYFKKLRRVTFISSIPKSASGKILRRELTQRATAKL